MGKAKSKAIAAVADGAGGMVEVRDRRFEQGDWPIRLCVPVDRAATWFQYLEAECAKRGWAHGGIAQREARENSGSITIRTAGAVGPQVVIVWDRRRNRPLMLRARSDGTPQLPVAVIAEFLGTVDEHTCAGATAQFHLSGQVAYDGLPWHGELWLDNNLRLGPPSKQDNTALLGPRIVLVNALVDGIDPSDAHARFEVMLREVSVFLTIVLGQYVHVPATNLRGWTWRVDSTGRLECDVCNLAYVEAEPATEMPHPGQVRQVSFRPVSRPDFSVRGIRIDDKELDLPSDIVEQWQRFVSLPADRRQQFVRAGSLWQLACSIDGEHATAAFALTVAACEALKPPERKFRNCNLYHVVAGLLGKQVADHLQEHWFLPQDTRNGYFHAGQTRGREFVPRMMLSSFEDPTFDHASRVLAQVSQAAIIEWLTRSGVFTMPSLKKAKTTGRRHSPRHA